MKLANRNPCIGQKARSAVVGWTPPGGHRCATVTRDAAPLRRGASIGEAVVEEELLVLSLNE